MPVMNGTYAGDGQARNDLLRIIISTDGSKPGREEARRSQLYVEKPFRPEVVPMSAKSPALNPADGMMRCRRRSSRS
jgi:hypothetical protein